MPAYNNSTCVNVREVLALINTNLLINTCLCVLKGENECLH